MMEGRETPPDANRYDSVWLAAGVGSMPETTCTGVDEITCPANDGLETFDGHVSESTTLTATAETDVPTSLTTMRLHAERARRDSPEDPDVLWGNALLERYGIGIGGAALDGSGAHYSGNVDK